MDVQEIGRKGNRHILIVEDSPTQAERLKYILEQHGYQVSVTKNGREALAAMDKRKPVVVISDIMMPEMDGYQLCRQIKADEKLKDLPVILLTSLADPVDVVKGLECGADNFITKPYEENYLLSRLQYILINRELQRSEKMQMGVEIFFAGRKYFIRSERQQILNLLLSTYETAVQKNLELIQAKDELNRLNEHLEDMVEERTTKLKEEIIERKRAEEALRKSESGLAQAQRIANLGSWEWDLRSGEVFWSDQMYRILGLDRQHFPPTYDSFLSRVHSEDRDLLDQAVQGSMTGDKPMSCEYRVLLPNDGMVRYFFAQAEVITDRNGTPIRMSGTAQDITERKQAEEALRQSEEQLRQAQKMEAVGRLAGGVAHDFNNLLTAIIGYSDILLNGLGESDPWRPDILEIKKAGERAATLTSQLLAFSRKQVLQPKVLDLNEVVTDMDKMLQRLIGEDIDLITLPDPALGRVKADPGGIEQIILNLAVNARDAMPEGGKLTIETANVDLDESYARGHVTVQPGPYVMLAVSDNGMGMSPETQAHIFEPFFTTKEKGKGTGLGLSTIYGIVKQSGGNIWVYSELGGGTTFKIYLPRVEEALTPVETSTPEDASRQGSETILLVEDDEVIRKLVSVILHDHGYTVLVARNGSEALKISEQHLDPIHLMLTDVVMPQMTVRELTQRLAEMCPQTRVLYVSGYTDEAIVHHGVLDEGMYFMQKPFTAVALLRKVREVLDEPQAGGGTRFGPHPEFDGLDQNPEQTSAC